MLKQVRKIHGIFTATDELNRSVRIVESISFIFSVEVDREDQRVIYRPVTYREAEILDEVVKYLRGKPCNVDMIQNIVIRFGWMDKRLNKLSFMGLTDLMTKIRTKKADNTQIRKLTDICKQLSLSQKVILK